MVEAPTQSEVKDVAVPKKGEEECTDGVASRDRKSRAFSTDWIDLCENLGKGQD